MAGRVAIRLAAVAATLAAVLAGPAAPAEAFPPVRPTRVLVLGDSVMKGAEQQFIAALGTDREVVVDAEVNRSTGTGADIVAERGDDWDVVVVMLGHNDGGNPGVFEPSARRLLDGLRQVPWVSWLSLHEVRDYYPPVNEFLTGLTGEYPNLHIADWNSLADQHAEGIAGDGLHLGPEGALAMAGLVTAEVEAAEADYQERFEAYVEPTTTTSTTVPPSSPTPEATTIEGDDPRDPCADQPAGCEDAPTDDSGVGWPVVGGAALALVAVGGTGVALSRRSGARGRRSR